MNLVKSKHDSAWSSLCAKWYMYMDDVLPQGLGSWADTAHRRTLRATRRSMLDHRKTIQNSRVLQVLTDLNRTLVFICRYLETWHKYFCRYKIQKESPLPIMLHVTNTLYLWFCISWSPVSLFYLDEYLNINANKTDCYNSPLLSSSNMHVTNKH